MTHLEDRVARLLDEVVPHPRRELDPAALMTDRRRPKVVRFARPLLAAAVVALLAVGLALWTHTSTRESPSADRKAPSSTATQAESRTAAQNQRSTEAAIERIVQALPLPAGASQVDLSAVTPTIPGPATHQESPNLVTTTRIWSVPGSADTVRRHIETHLPAGMTLSGNGSDPTYGNYLIVTVDTRWRDPAILDAPTVQIIVKQLARSVGVRADAAAIWLPPRTPDQLIPLTVTGLTVQPSRAPSASASRKIIGRDETLTIAVILNRLNPVAPATRSCPADRNATTTLTFALPGKTKIAELHTSGCSYVRIGSGPALQPNQQLTDAIARATKS